MQAAFVPPPLFLNIVTVDLFHSRSPMKHPVPSLSLRPLSLFPLLLLIPVTAPAAPSPEDIARQQEQRQRQREEQLREHMQPAGHVRLDGGETPMAAPTSGHDAASQPCFPIRRVELTGEGAAQFQFALGTALKQNRGAREHIIEANGIHITTVNGRSKASHNNILRNGGRRFATQEEINAIKSFVK